MADWRTCHPYDREHRQESGISADDTGSCIEDESQGSFACTVDGAAQWHAALNERSAVVAKYGGAVFGPSYHSDAPEAGRQQG